MPMLRRLLDGDPPAIDDFELLAHLGEGGFGNVYVSRWRQHPEQFAAVKELKLPLDDPDSPGRFLAEIISTRKIKSAFMPEFLDGGVSDRRFQGAIAQYPIVQYPWVATRLIAGLPLNEIIRRCGPLPEEMVWHLGAGIVTAIADIHATNRVHRDLKPDNALVAINGPWVIDLGLAHLMGTKHLMTSRFKLGHPQYAAPEWWEGGVEAAGTPADIYSLGAVLLVAATGHSPYRAPVDPRQVRSSPDLDGLPAGSLRELIQSCLTREEADRPDVGELRAKFGSRTGDVGRAAFPDVLPEPVTSVLVEHLVKLADVTGTWGPAELGWGPDLRQSDVTPPHEESGWGWKRGDSSPVATEATLDLVLPSAPTLRVAPVPPSRTLTAEWSVTWTREVEGWIRGPLAVHGDMVVVASLDGSVAALSTRDGTPPAAWAESVRTRAALHAGPLIVSDGVRRGTAYVGDADGFVHGIDLASGRDDVVLEAGAAIEGTPVEVRGSIPGAGDSAVIVDWLYALTSDGWLHSVDLRTGESTLLYPMERPATGTLATSFGLIFAASTDGSVSAIDAITGKRDWWLPTDGQVLAAPLELASWLYVCGTDGILRQVTIQDGREAATTPVGAPVHCAPVGDAYRVYVAGGDGVIRAYDVSHPDRERLDAPIWQRDVDHEVAGLAVAAERVYVSAGHHLVELDAATGLPMREAFSMDSLIGTAPVISGRNCYVASLGGVVTCLSLT
jgi:serine/threonine protein kinase/outer membrane protein assembly factor BamB